jgi:hypothetical protein
MTPQLLLACRQTGQKAVGYTIRKLLANVAVMEGKTGLDVPRQLLLTLAASLMMWLQGSAPDGIDANLVAVAGDDLEVAEHWASWVRDELLAAAPLRQAMANEIDSAIAVVRDVS